MLSTKPGPGSLDHQRYFKPSVEIREIQFKVAATCFSDPLMFYLSVIHSFQNIIKHGLHVWFDCR